jgi:hypothetical protein
MIGLNGKVAIITGAARGLGAATAQVLGREGVRLVLTDVLDDVGQQTCQDLLAQGYEVISATMTCPAKRTGIGC